MRFARAMSASELAPGDDILYFASGFWLSSSVCHAGCVSLRRF
jgi:hypothetical protein